MGKDPLSDFNKISGTSPGAANEQTAGQPGGKIQTMKKKTFDQAFETAHVRDTSREPAAIQAEIDKELAKQREAVRVSIELTGDARRRLTQPLTKPYEKMASDPVQIQTIAKQRTKYDEAAARLADLERELIVSQQVRE